MARADFCGDCSKARRQIFDAAVAEVMIETVAQPLPADQTAVAGKIKIEIAEDTPRGQLAREGFDLWQMASCKAPADDGADRRAGDNVWLDTSRMLSFQDADVSPTAGSAASQSQTDFHSSHGVKPLETCNHSAHPSDNVVSGVRNKLIPP